jgi:hypothetical protein
MLNREGEPYRLFDVKKDPHEMEDLIGEKEDDNLIKELKRRIVERQTRNQ